MLDALKLLWDVTEGLHPFLREPLRVLLIALAIAASIAVLSVPVLKAWQALRGAPVKPGFDMKVTASQARNVAANIREPAARYLLQLAAKRYGQPPNAQYDGERPSGRELLLTHVAETVELRSFLRRFCADIGIIRGHPADFVERLRFELSEGASLNSGAMIGLMQSGHAVAPIAQYLAVGLQLYAPAAEASSPLLRYFLDGEHRHPNSVEVARHIYYDQLKRDPERKLGLTQMLAELLGPA